MWYVIWTSTSHENKCLAEMEERYSALFDRIFVPQRTLCRKRGPVWVNEDVALFPGYLFVDTDEERVEDLASRLYNNSGFNLVLSTDGKFLPLPDDEAEFIEFVYNKDGTFDMSTGIIEGDTIRVTGGPLSGLEGNITKINRHKRIAILELTMFGKKTKTEVGLEIIHKK